MMGTRTIHMCICVRGQLSKTKRKLLHEWRGCIKRGDGTALATAEEIREFFMDELAKGHEVIPFGECDNFDWKTGCKGHESTEAA